MKKLVDFARDYNPTKPKKVKAYTQEQIFASAIKIKIRKAIKNNQDHIYLHMPLQNQLSFLSDQGLHCNKSNINGSDMAYKITW